MEIISTEEAKGNVLEFTTSYIRLLEAKKILQQDIKDLKDNYKEEGVPVGIVCKVFNQIKADKKKSETEIAELDIIRDWLESDQSIDDSIGILGAK
jgi:uncharacterized protein (UPF0335 family)